MTLEELILSIEVEKEQTEKKRARALAEIKTILAKAKNEGRAALSEEEDGEGGGDDDGELGDDGELYQQALDVLKSTKRASTSMLQRRLRIGYNRAARIMEIMEEKGIVGPENGSSPREILVDLDAL